jgi:hypothetical protein
MTFKYIFFLWEISHYLMQLRPSCLLQGFVLSFVFYAHWLVSDTGFPALYNAMPQINNFIERVKCLYGVSEDSDPLGPASIAFGLPVHECEGLARYCVELFNKKGYLSEFPIKVCSSCLQWKTFKVVTKSFYLIVKAPNPRFYAIESDHKLLGCSTQAGYWN